MSARARVLTFGFAALLGCAGVICAFIADGRLGDAVAIALMLAGFGALVLLAFLEVGLSEDRQRAKEEATRAEQGKEHRPGTLRLPRRPRRPG